LKDEAHPRTIWVPLDGDGALGAEAWNSKFE